MIRFVPSGSPKIADIQEVGNYALRFVWEDGHNSGIYSFVYLRTLEGASEEQQFTR